ncbi:hypothetical protein [Burkholderia sp. LMG 21824]|uniref:hypothetical protein n=1 Tax=Burkholderia sp. LMG 21824 TaxID=3158172 RepID=UPI003C2B4AB3
MCSTVGAGDSFVGGMVWALAARRAVRRCVPLCADRRSGFRRVSKWQNMPIHAVLCFFIRMSSRVAIVRNRAPVPEDLPTGAASGNRYARPERAARVISTEGTCNRECHRSSRFL